VSTEVASLVPPSLGLKGRGTKGEGLRKTKGKGDKGGRVKKNKREGGQRGKGYNTNPPLYVVERGIYKV